MALKAAIREISQLMLNTHSRRTDFILKDLTTTDQILAHWMALILVSGSNLKITFKAHFATHLAKNLAAPIYGKSTEELSDEQSLDFMKEFCNLSAGSIKRVLLNIEQKTGVSIPVVTRGFDELFFSTSSLPNVFADAWTLTCALGQLHCSAVIELFQPVDLSQVRVDSDSSGSDNQGDVEFL